MTPPGFDVRSRVHEYGGGAWIVAGDAIVFSNDADGRLYRQPAAGEPAPITPEPGEPRALRYADPALVAGGDSIVCIRETHGGDEPVNEVVRVALDGGGVEAIASGHDFFAAPRPSPDGSRLAWLSWDHPRMPWDGTALWVADADGGDAVVVAGGEEESVGGAGVDPDGVLHFVSDRTDWWNLYRPRDGVELVAPVEGGARSPAWVFGMQSYVFLGDGTILCARRARRVVELRRIAPGSRRAEVVDVGLTPRGTTLATDGGASPTPARARRTAPRSSSSIRRPGRRRSSRAQAKPRSTRRRSRPRERSRSRPRTAPRRTRSTTRRATRLRGGAGRRAAAVDRPLARRADRERQRRARPRDPVLDESRASRSSTSTTAARRGYGRAYRDRLDGALGRRRRRGLRRRRASTWPTPGRSTASGWRSAAAAPAASRRSRADDHRRVHGRRQLLRGRRRRGARRATRTSSSRATSTRLIGPYPEAGHLYRERSPINHVDGSRPA